MSDADLQPITLTPEMWAYYIYDREGAMAFLSACREAADDDRAFSRFRSCEPIRAMVENRPTDRAEVNWSIVKSIYPPIIKYLGTLERLDAVGGPPEIVELSDGIRLSPTTITTALQYALTMFLFEGFPPRITEIGAGYGSLAAMTLMLQPHVQYTILDLSEPAALQYRFLSALGVACRVDWRDMLEDAGNTHGQVVAHASLCEMMKAARQYFYRFVLRCSYSGWVCWCGNAGLVEPEARFAEYAYGELSLAMAPTRVRWTQLDSRRHGQLAGWRRAIFYWGV